MRERKRGLKGSRVTSGQSEREREKEGGKKKESCVFGVEWKIGQALLNR